MLRKFLYLLILLLSLALCALYLNQGIIRWSNSPKYYAGERFVELRRGQDLKSFSRELKIQGLIDNSLFFEFWVKLYSQYNLFQAGLYRFQSSTSPQLIAEQITAGKIFVPIELTLTIPEGSSVRDVCKILQAKDISDLQLCLQEFRNKTYPSDGELEGVTLEGYLYPATYSFSKKPTLDDFIEQALKAFKSNTGDLIDSLAERGLTLYQGLIFASLIEKEVASFDEYPMVSEVIWARLQSKMALGIDAAIIYGIDNFDGDLTFDHLKDSSNLYNLRMHIGLPPTPICSPSRAALKAVIGPTAAGYLYYVKVASDEKRHNFSRNLSEHNQRVRELVEYEKRAK